MSLTVKAFFKDEIRRIPIEASNATSFDLLGEKIRTIFSELPARGRLVMQWKDADGDLVTFSSDEELIEALGSVANGIFKVYLDDKEEKEHKLGNKGFCELMECLKENLVGLGAAFDSDCGLTNHESSPNEYKPDQFWSDEEKENLDKLSSKIRVATKEKMVEICGREDASGIEDCIDVALRSSVQRATRIQRDTGGLPAKKAKKIPKQLKKEGSSSSDDDDSDHETSDAKDVQRGVNKKLQKAVKEIEKLTFVEANEKFGKMAAKWASQAVGQTFREAVIHLLKHGMLNSSNDDQPKLATKESSANEKGNFSGNDEARSSSSSSSSYFGNPSSFADMAPHFQELGNFLFGLGGAAVKDDKAVQNAVDVFKNMGFNLDQNLVEEIKKAQGDISRVFENMKKR